MTPPINANVVNRLTQVGYLPINGPAVVPSTVGTEPVFLLPVPRTLSFIAGPGVGTANVYTFSYDQWGSLMTEITTIGQGQTVKGAKAHYALRRIYFEPVGVDTPGFSIQIQTMDNIGLPYYCSGYENLLTSHWDGTSGPVGPETFTSGDTTTLATGSTGDVRGLVGLPSASDGVSVLTLRIWIPGATGSNGTLTGQQAVQGVPQYNRAFI